MTRKKRKLTYTERLVKRWRRPTAQEIAAKEGRSVLELLANANVLEKPEFPVRKSKPLQAVLCFLVEGAIKEALARDILRLPDLSYSESVSMFTDFGGESQSELYNSYSFLVCAHNPLGFVEKMKEVRRKHRLGTKEIAHKELARHGPSRRALPDYFRALDNRVPGLLLTVGIPRQMSGLITGQANDREVVKNELDILGGPEWPVSVAEKAVRIAHVGAYLIALLTRDGQNVLWTTDHDAITQPEARGKQTVAMWDSVVRDYGRTPGKVGWALPFENRDDMTFHDLLSATDLAAATVSRWGQDTAGGRSRDRPWDDLIGMWICNQGIALRKLSFLVLQDESDGGTYSLRLAAGSSGAENFERVMIPLRR